MADKGNSELLIIDGHAMAFRAHYAMIRQNLRNKDGMPTETIFGFFRMLLTLLKQREPDYLLIVFDPDKPTFRHEMYADYKGTRKETPEELKLQLDELQEMIRLLHLPVAVPDNEEADDLIASMAVSLKKNSRVNVSIVSGDKDLYSVLDKKTKLLRAVKGVTEFTEFDDKKVKEKTGVETDRIADYMALMGDSSDNVPGVKGIGEKTAAKLLSEYKSLDDLYENLEKVKPERISRLLEKDRENAYLSRDLVTLKTDMKNLPDLKNLKWPADIPEKAEKNLFTDRGFISLQKEWSDLTGSEEQLSDGPAICADMSILRKKAELEKWLKFTDKASEIAVDTETTSLDATSAALIGLSLSVKKNGRYRTAYIPLNSDREHEAHFDYTETDDAGELLAVLKPLLENAKIDKVGQNIKYDAIVLERHGVDLKGFYKDTMIASYMLNPNQRRHNLDDLALTHLGHRNISFEEIAGKGKKQVPLVSIELEKLAQYAAEDAEVTLRLSDILFKQLKKEKLSDLYEKIDEKLLKVLIQIEQNGIKLDAGYLSDLEKKYRSRLEKIENDIYKQAGHEFNIASTRELGTVLFDELEIESVKKTDKGARSTDANTLEMIRDQHKIVPLILDYRALSKLLNTYISTLPGYINSETERVHTSFSQIIAATGRLASSDPNLQNIPVKDEDGRAIRHAFVAEKSHSLLTLDYSQIELRILAHYSEDKHLLQAYRNNEDIHDQATYLLFRNRFDAGKSRWVDGPVENDKPAYEIDFDILEKMKKTSEFKEKRSQAKILNFSIVYGVTDFGLSRNLGIDRAESKNLIEMYFETFSGIRDFMNSAVEKARERGFTENYFGRRRLLVDINAKNRFKREASERLAVNTPIQSTAADIIKLAMIEIQKKIRTEKMKTRMLLQVHDELVFEVPADEKDEAYEMISEYMQNGVSLKVPLLVEGGFGSTWEEAK